ncbi:MAG: PilZ domain-containing protein [Anaerolineales bacterium]|nr:PilZ domain-containing protein [Anaerolineales bacterium]
MPEKRTIPRKKVNLYMAVFDDDTGQILGHMVEASLIGARLETQAALPLERDYYLRIELTPDLGAPMPYIVFIARTKWCKTDVIQPNLYQVGFEVVEIVPEDKAIFNRIIKKYTGV